MKIAAINSMIAIVLFTGCMQNKNEIKSAEETSSVSKRLADFGIQAHNVFLYYEDLSAAADFYTQVLGIEQVADYGMARILRVAADSYFILVDASAGMHSADEPKTVAVALVTDQLDEWYEYLTGAGYDMKYDYKPKESSAHDGFVMEDPEGYVLEFERFNDHEENRDFIPLLDKASTITNANREGILAPEDLGFKATVTWLYYKDILAMQDFYENKLGLLFLVDQGWAKVLKVSETGFLGLVDEKKGMHSYTEKKAVTVSFFLDDLDGWYNYSREKALYEFRSDSIGTGPEGKYREFVGYDPEGYFIEFDLFYPHALNTALLEYLEE
jgi:catechol 2,3-dioxygenase-like lactoylglutathione lyase family enzyme